MPNIQRQPVARVGQQQYSGQQQYPRPPVTRQAAAASLGEWRASASRPERNQAGQQWRQQHQNWDQSAVWRQNSTWWRGDDGFRLFTGLRIGFFFVPNRGYLVLPSQYRNSHWQAGDYLPSWFRSYTVSDYARYGLPPPPYGCVWVWLNGDVALIDPSDGYILDVARNAW
ncbi:MAG TPA: RcnB family protein [Phenylobacterium sp.]|nr:RcnB family protein [Phenylobacterium sp.]